MYSKSIVHGYLFPCFNPYPVPVLVYSFDGSRRRGGCCLTCKSEVTVSLGGIYPDALLIHSHGDIPVGGRHGAFHPLQSAQVRSYGWKAPCLPPTGISPCEW